MLWWKLHSIIHLFRYANEGSKTTSEQRKHSVSECSCTYISCQIFSKGNSDSVLRLLLEFVMFWGKYVLLFNSNFMWSLWYLKYNISQKWVSQVSHRSLNIRLLLTCFNVCTVCESFYRVVSRYTLAIHLEQTLQRLLQQDKESGVLYLGPCWTAAGLVGRKGKLVVLTEPQLWFLEAQALALTFLW